MLQKITTLTAKEEVIKQLITLIKDGKLKPGDKLPNEKELMEKLSVGRSTIREAKQVLISKNILESYPGKGTFIKDLEFDVILDEDVLDAILKEDDVLYSLYEAREIIDIETAVLAAQRATDDDISKITHALQLMKEAMDEDELFEQGLHFHMAICKASHNPILIRLYYLILKLLRKNQYSKYVINMQDEIRIHEDIVIALKEKCVNKTREAVNAHFNYVRESSKEN
ncbi:FadR/GntR family transcriptional regulator [Evansella cellulosilytica]|uniref:FadR/GntR family transcriptional regulator n=1 Tax=Evansella cellulosilytica TaxID=1413 RepID=UPI0002E4EEE2|nr:FadR/GntR family transcriptional regulator [Evansella cellulosilytica]